MAMACSRVSTVIPPHPARFADASLCRRRRCRGGRATVLLRSCRRRRFRKDSPAIARFPQDPSQPLLRLPGRRRPADHDRHFDLRQVDPFVEDLIGRPGPDNRALPAPAALPAVPSCRSGSTGTESETAAKHRGPWRSSRRKRGTARQRAAGTDLRSRAAFLRRGLRSISWRDRPASPAAAAASLHRFGTEFFPREIRLGLAPLDAGTPHLRERRVVAALLLGREMDGNANTS